MIVLNLKNKRTPRKRVTIDLYQEDVDYIKTIADEMGISSVLIIRHCINEFIDKCANEVKNA